jgi:hypothetical protein
VEITSIGLVFTTLFAMAWRVLGAMDTTWDWVNLGFTGLTGYLIADFISGLVHWAGDTIGDESTPFLGKNFVTPFRYHHVDPKDITRHDFIETNGNNCIVVVTPLASAYLLLPRETTFGFFCATLMGFIALFIVATNQFHKWAHTDEPPRFAAWLQRWGLILSTDHHDVHHAQPHDQQYCITVGWMNPLLNRVRFFRAVEAVIAAVRPDWLHLEERHAAHGLAGHRHAISAAVGSDADGEPTSGVAGQPRRL